MEIRHYLTETASDPYQEWIDKLKDFQGRITIQRRVDRLAKGNFGDHKFCRDGVWEMRINVGPGYRVYYAQAGKTVVLLLCGGAKRTQDSDIDKAAGFWMDYKRRLS